MSRIALVDDDRALLSALARALEAEGFTVDAHADGQAALDAFARRRPDLAVLDIRMPRCDGFDVLRRLQGTPSLPVILLSGLDGEDDELVGLRLGADDYVRKPASARLLAERIRATLRRARGASCEPEALVRGDLTMDAESHAVTWKGRRVALTVTEFGLLKALAGRPGRVKTRDQLLDVAHGDRIHVDDRTIDSHIKRVRRKIRRVDPDFAAIETLYGLGYRFNEA